jgi:hypothetical protein
VADLRLLDRVGDYHSGVLSWVQPDGYPASSRCTVRVVAETGEAPRLALEGTGLPVEPGGRACVLFHRHDERLEGLHQMVVKGTLATGDRGLELVVDGIVTANGRGDTDAMPHASAPLHMLAFYRAGRSAAKAYLAKRGSPWPPIPFGEIGRKVAEHQARRG